MKASQNSVKYLDTGFSPREREITVVNTKKYVGVDIGSGDDSLDEEDEDRYQFSLDYED